MESIICRYLISLYEKDENIARYDNLPAVFDTKAPDDLDELWQNNIQYPRIITELKMQSDAERKISGQLYIDVMCKNEMYGVHAEEMESAVKAAVDGCFFSNKDMTISAQWRRSDPFSEKDNELSGITLTFDVLAYPVQVTDPPDPVAAVNLWLKTLYSGAYVIGKDTLHEVWKPTDKSPAIYCRLSALGESIRMKSTAAVTWIGADMKVNVMAPSEQVRSTIIKNSIQLLTNATRLMLNDGSPMLLDRIQANMAADPLKDGQIQIKATYGVLNTFPGTPLNHIFVTGKGKVSNSVAQHKGATDEDALTDNDSNLLIDNDGLRLLSE